MRRIIGRKREQEELNNLLDSTKSEFVAIYGRRRVGKTFLVRSVLERRFTFFASGLQSGSYAEQIKNINEEVVNFGGSSLKPASNWSEAFTNIRLLVDKAPKEEKKVIFLDEVPWMSSKNSGFLSALDHFWNRWISMRNDVLLIVCGSATSWILDNIVNNVGGLHNRLTAQLLLSPFTLHECEEFFIDSGVNLPRFQILEAYMIFGGIPYYLDLFKPNRSLAQNVDLLYFSKDGPLRNEYNNLYPALFAQPEGYIKVIEALASKKSGLIREEIATKAKITSGGRLTRVLQDLINCGFIQEYFAFGKQLRGKTYQLIDMFTLFHLTFGNRQRRGDGGFWLHFSVTPAHASWSGFAFELVCMKHINQLKMALGISGVQTEISTWRSRESSSVAQIDLIIDRSDQIIHLCEMKYSSSEYIIDKSYSDKLRRRSGIFVSETKTNKAVHTTLVTTYGLIKNTYSKEIIFQLDMSDLFRN